MRILKNVLEVQFDNSPCFIHRDNVAGIKCYKNHPINKRGEYIVDIYLIHPIDQIDEFDFGCNDAEPYIAWFNGDYTPEKSIVRNTCKCCNEQMDSVCERPAFANELLCNMCNDAKIYLESIPGNPSGLTQKPNVTLPPSVAIAYGLYDLASIHEKEVK